MLVVWDLETAWKASNLLAQGNALGKEDVRDSPWKGKSLNITAFALSGRLLRTGPTQGVALGYVLVGLSGRFQVPYNQHLFQELVLSDSNIKEPFFPSAPQKSQKAERKIIFTPWKYIITVWKYIFTPWKYIFTAWK